MMFAASIPVRCQVLSHAAELPLPEYHTQGAAGFDLRAAINEPVTLYPGDRAMIPVGLAFAIPDGYELQVRPRSGNAANFGLAVLNSPGTIDSDYRGEVKVIVYNAGSEDIQIDPGMRVAQAVLCPVLRAKFHYVASLEDTERGAGGFGSTGTQ